MSGRVIRQLNCSPRQLLIQLHSIALSVHTSMCILHIVWRTLAMWHQTSINTWFLYWIRTDTWRRTEQSGFNSCAHRSTSSRCPQLVAGDRRLRCRRCTAIVKHWPAWHGRNRSDALRKRQAISLSTKSTLPHDGKTVIRLVNRGHTQYTDRLRHVLYKKN